MHPPNAAGVAYSIRSLIAPPASPSPSAPAARADGYTLLLAGLSSAFNATVYKKLNFDFIRDIAPVASIGGGPYVMVVNSSVPAKTVAEFIVYAKANPGKINMASSGNGSVSHVFGELFKMMTGA